MGLSIPQVITPSKASGAQVIDGSLKFDDSANQHLERTISASNRRTFTLSAWVKHSTTDSNDRLLGNYTDSTNYSSFYFRDTPDFQISFVERVSDTYYVNAHSRRMARDTGWYHIVWAVDTTQATDTDRVKLYVNGVQETLNASYSSGTLNTNAPTLPSQNYETRILGAYDLKVGARSGTDCWDGLMSQFYVIDGAALGPENFGFTDPLTNTWKPKKYNHRTDLYGVTWSTALVGDAAGFQSPVGLAADGFDGEVGSANGQYAQNNTGSNPSTITFTPVGGIKFNSSIQVYIINAANTVNVNGEGAQTIAADQWVTVKTGSGTLDTLVFSRPTTGGASFAAIRIDGHILIDSQNDNSFYLPLDGNSPIGEDKSGNGNDFTPVNFGGSVTLDSPQVSGARPILNTTQGGTQAGVGVFGSKQNVGYAVTVYNDGGGNKYYIDGVKQDTVTGLIRGATYTFDTSDSTVSSHPFRFSATSNGSHGGGSEYTNGVAAITGAATTITVPYNAPNTLYYYCTSHSGMGADITGITTNEKLADQYASDCIFATPFVGIKSDISVSIACTSTEKSLVDYGDPVGVTTNSVFYGGSFYYDGNDGHDLGVINDTAFEIGSADFCIEGWFNANTTLDSTYWNPILTLPWHGHTNNESQIFIGFAGGDSSPYSAGEFHARIRDSSGNKELPSGLTTLYNDNTWHHFALTKNGTLAAIFVDGVLKKTVTTEASLNTGLDDQKGYIATYNNNTGSPGSPQGFYKGYLNDLRIYKGAAKYVGVTTGVQYFVPPSTSPDILPDTPSGVAGGSKLTKITDGAVTLEDNNDYLTVSKSSDFAYGTGDFTIEAYINLRSTPSANIGIIDHRDGGEGTATKIQIAVTTDNTVKTFVDGSNQIETLAVVRPNTWQHIAYTRSGTTGRIFVDGILQASGTDSKNYSANARVAIGNHPTVSSRNFPGSISNLRIVKGTALYTSRFTPPTVPLTNVTNTKLLTFQSTSFYAAVAPLVSGVNNGTVWSSSRTGDSLFRSGYPAVDAFNGVTKTSTEDCAATPQVTGQGFTFLFGGGVPFTTLQMQCDHNNGTTVTANGVNITSQLSSGSLTNTTITGVTSPLTSLSVVSHNGDAGYLGSVTIDGTMLVDPFVPNGNAAATNFNPFITDINTVRGQETGYCTLNPFNNNGGTLSNGNLSLTSSGAANVSATLQIPTTGKWYWEYLLDGLTSGGVLGIADGSAMRGTALSNWTKIYGYSPNGNKYENASASSYGATLATGDLVGVKYDADTRQLEFLKNNNSQGVAYTVSSDYDYYPSIHGNIIEVIANFGQKPFKFSPPEGYQPLNIANTRPVNVISRPDQYVGVATYTGSSGNVVVNNLNFKPDAVWMKQRNSGGGTNDHVLVDSVRGRAKSLYPSATYSENTSAADKDLISFDRNGFTVGPTNQSAVNRGSSYNYVAWCWKAGGNKNTFNVDDVGYASAAAAGLNGGTLTVTGASVGTKQGFSIIKYTGSGSAGDSASHGLSEAPKFIITKNIDNGTYNWRVFTTVIDGTNDRVFLNTTAAQVAQSDAPVPTSSLFYVGANLDHNKLNDNIIAYLWHDVPGLQKFGTFEGNENADGPFIELGFRPSLILMRNLDNSGTNYDWCIYDNARSTSNPNDKFLCPNLAKAENVRGDNSTDNARYVDFLSNGFKIRNNASAINLNSHTIFYAAWADVPTVDLYGGGANAR